MQRNPPASRTGGETLGFTLANRISTYSTYSLDVHAHGPPTLHPMDISPFFLPIQFLVVFTIPMSPSPLSKRFSPVPVNLPCPQVVPCLCHLIFHPFPSCCVSLLFILYSFHFCAYRGPSVAPGSLVVAVDKPMLSCVAILPCPLPVAHSSQDIFHWQSQSLTSIPQTCG